MAAGQLEHNSLANFPLAKLPLNESSKEMSRKETLNGTRVRRGTFAFARRTDVFSIEMSNCTYFVSAYTVQSTVRLESFFRQWPVDKNKSYLQIMINQYLAHSIGVRSLRVYCKRQCHLFKCCIHRWLDCAPIPRVPHSGPCNINSLFVIFSKRALFNWNCQTFEMQ